VTYFEDIAVGDITELGAFTFTAETIKRFARSYDPQPFHVDEAAASASPYGGLIASGWHVASIWMKLRVAYQSGLIARAEAAGKPPLRLGPSPGFRNMEWAKPVRPGDTLRYGVRTTGTKESASRPEWGIVSMLGYADNQHGERAFQFEGVVFWGRKGGAP
jgi:acyl dehydratase